MATPPISVAVLFNHVDEDEYEMIRDIDPASLSFEPEYDIHVATVMEEYRAVVRALATDPEMSATTMISGRDGRGWRNLGSAGTPPYDNECRTVDRKSRWPRLRRRRRWARRAASARVNG